MTEVATVVKSKNLVTKLAEILGAIEKVPKNGFNSFHGYKYATEADVSECLRKELSARNVFVWSSVESLTKSPVTNKEGKPTGEDITLVWMNFEFEDGETGEKKLLKYPGEGADSRDKGAYKAMTGALKYFLLKNFLVSSGDDPEKESPAEKQAVPANAATSNRPRPPAPPANTPTNPRPVAAPPKAEIPISDSELKTPASEPYKATDADLPAIFTEDAVSKEDSKAFVAKTREYIKKLTDAGVEDAAGQIRGYMLRLVGKGETKALTRSEWREFLSKLEEAAQSNTLVELVVVNRKEANA